MLTDLKEYKHKCKGFADIVYERMILGEETTDIPKEYFTFELFFNSHDNDFDMAEAITHYGELYHYTLEMYCKKVLLGDKFDYGSLIERLAELRKPETVSRLVCDFYKASKCLELHETYTDLLEHMDTEIEALGMDKPDNYKIGDFIELDIVSDYYKETKGIELSVDELAKLTRNDITKLVDYNHEAYYYRGSVNLYELILL